MNFNATLDTFCKADAQLELEHRSVLLGNAGLIENDTPTRIAGRRVACDRARAAAYDALVIAMGDHTPQEIAAYKKAWSAGEVVA